LAKLIILMHISFDGFAATPNGGIDWIKHDEEIFEYVSKHISKVGTGIYGPITFHMMESYWPGVLNDPQSGDREIKHARWYQTARKIICSRTLKHLENKEAELIQTNLEQGIQRIKLQSEKDMMVFGSPRLTQALARLDLIDEYLLNVNPILLGGGIRLFEDLPITKLELKSATTFSSGVVGFHYKKQI
jgi:dihydrofolate reductase